MHLIKLSKEEWQKYSENAHLLAFDETGYSGLERCDYAFLVVDNEKPCGYATIKEADSETAYLQRGGTFPETRGTANSFRVYAAVIDYMKQNYKFLTTRIENTNTPMLKFAMKVGFVIDGISYHKNKVYLEHFMEVSNVVVTTSSDSTTRRSTCEQAS
jgi:RimJ/RimL family protein N-acetyltransferase